jgi:RNA recognition motif-containing protein
MTNIFVAKLDYNMTQEELKQLFEQYGTVTKVSIATDRETGKSKGFAFLEMKNDDEAQRAISSLDGHKINSRPITVKQAEDRPKKEFNPADRKTTSTTRSETGSERTPFKQVDPLENEPSSFEKPFVKTENKIQKKKDPISKKLEDRPKSQKMTAYKKSGKQPKFFLDDEDDDLY